MNQIRYVPGETVAVVSAQGVVLLAGEHSEALAIAEQELSVTSLIETVTARGLTAAPSFAAVISTAGQTHVIVRGDFSVTVVTADSTETVDGGSIATWTERVVGDISASFVDISHVSATEGTLLPVRDGVVLASRVQFGEKPAEPEPDAEPTSGHEAPAIASVPETGGDIAAESDAIDAAQPEPEALVAPEPVSDDPAPESVVGAEPTLEASADDEPESNDPNATIMDPVDSSFDAMFGATIANRRPEDAAVRELIEESDATAASAAPDGPPPPPPGDHDGLTVARSDVQQMRSDHAANDAAQAAQNLGTVTFSTGQQLDLDGALLVGRSPRVQAVGSAQVPHIVVIDDPYVSSTHLQLAVQGQVATATDLSSNGTLIARPSKGNQQVALEKDVATPLEDGAVLTLAEGVTATIALTSAGSP